VSYRNIVARSKLKGNHPFSESYCWPIAKKAIIVLDFYLLIFYFEHNELFDS
jgi:hypothetical protein